MKTVRAILVVALLAVILTGCAAHVYNMGSGPQTGQTESARQWYIIWGLIPLNNPNVPAMIGNAQNYQIRTAQEPVDVIINIFTSYITVTSRTVTVKK